MSCRECGCFTLFKDICSSCKRASSVFDELAINSYKPPEVELSADEDILDDAILRSESNPEERVLVDAPTSLDFHEDNQISDHSAAPENVTAVAAKLGINLGDLQGAFDVNELSAVIANAVPPTPVNLIACQNCAQKIKLKIKCPYCGHANNNF